MARPFLVAYVVAIGFTLGLLVNRTPPQPEIVPAISGTQHHGQGSTEREVKEPPLLLQLFQPSQPTARLMLRMGLPLLAVADGSAMRMENQHLITYWTGKGGHKPQTLFGTVLPFLAEPPGLVEAPRPEVPPETRHESPPPQPAPQPKETPPSPQPAKPAVINNGLPLVGIYHTHDWETYISEFSPGWSVRNQADLNRVVSYDHSKRTIVDLGHSLAVALRDRGITTVHAPFWHQDKGYDYAYASSRNTAKKILREAPSTKILLDLHRDGLYNLKTTAVIRNQKVAQIRCIIGTADQPRWQQNRAFCDKLIARLEQMYPGITLPTREQKDTYNQDLMPGALLLEIGSASNHYAEAERSIKYLAEALAGLVQAGEYPK